MTGPVMSFDFMQFDINPIYLVWLFVAVSAGLVVEAVYLIGFSAASYRSRINRRLALSKDRTGRESVLVELRRERGLTGGGDYQFNLVALNRLVLQSGLTLGVTRILVIVAVVSLLAFAATMLVRVLSEPASQIARVTQRVAESKQEPAAA